MKVEVGVDVDLSAPGRQRLENLLLIEVVQRELHAVAPQDFSSSLPVLQWNQPTNQPVFLSCHFLTLHFVFLDFFPWVWM